MFKTKNTREWIIALAGVGFSAIVFTMLFMAVLFVRDFGYGEGERFRFGAMVRFEVKDLEHFCNGRVRNKLFFGYYQIDSVFCYSKTYYDKDSKEGKNGMLSSSGFDSLRKSKIVHEDDMQWLFTKHTDETTGYQSYSPIEPEGDHIEESMLTTYPGKDNQWHFNYTGEVVPKEKGDPVKMDKLLYGDMDMCIGAIDGFLWVKSMVKQLKDKSLVKEVKEEIFPWVSGCKRVHPELKRHKKFSKLMDVLLTDFWGSKENAKKDYEETFNKIKAIRAAAVKH